MSKKNKIRVAIVAIYRKRFTLSKIVDRVARLIRLVVSQ